MAAQMDTNWPSRSSPLSLAEPNVYVPKDVLSIIFEYVGADDWCNLLLVCRQWHKIVTPLIDRCVAIVVAEAEELATTEITVRLDPIRKLAVAHAIICRHNIKFNLLLTLKHLKPTAAGASVAHMLVK